MGDWTFFSNYGHVLIYLERNRAARLRDVAVEVGITERAVQKIVRDLQDANFLTISKQGRCNRYQINKRKALRHGLESHCSVGKLLTLLAKPAMTKGPVVEHESEPETEADVTLSAGPPEPHAVEETQLEKERKKEKKRAPVDTREQGSLF